MTKRIVALVVAVALVALAVPTEAGHRWRNRPTDLDIAMANVRQTFNTPLGYLYSGLSYDRYNPYSSWGNDPYWGRRHDTVNVGKLAISAAIIGGAVLLSKKHTDKADDPVTCFEKAMKAAKKYDKNVDPDQVMAWCSGQPVAVTQPTASPAAPRPQGSTVINATGTTATIGGTTVMPNATLTGIDITTTKVLPKGCYYEQLGPNAYALRR